MDTRDLSGDGHNASLSKVTEPLVQELTILPSEDNVSVHHDSIMHNQLDRSGSSPGKNGNVTMVRTNLSSLFPRFYLQCAVKC